MEELIVRHLPSLVTGAFGLTFMFVGLMLGSSERRFLRKSFVTKGKIVKYRSEDGHAGDRPYVEFEHEGKTITVRSTTRLNADENRSKVGSEVPIRCLKKTPLGIETWDVRVVEEENGEEGTVVKFANGRGIAGIATTIVEAVLLPTER